MTKGTRVTGHHGTLDETRGKLTTQKVDALLASGARLDIVTRKDLARALRGLGVRISNSGVEAWFRHVDRNYAGVPRLSLSDKEHSYPIPRRQVDAVLQVFALGHEDIRGNDDDFRTRCFRLSHDRLDATPRVRNLSADVPVDLVGRASAYADLRQAFAQTLDGRASLVCITGEAGIGKSTLIGATRKALDSVDCNVLFGAAVEESSAPLLAVIDMLRLDAERIAAVQPELRARLDALFERYRNAGLVEGGAALLFVELSDVLLTMARGKPLVVFLEDVHWADEATLRFLEYLASSVLSRSGVPLLVVLSARDVESEHRFSAFVARFAAKPYFHRIALERLSLLDIAAMLASDAGAPLADELVDVIDAMAMGNPLFAREVLASMRRQGALYTRRGRVFAHNNVGVVARYDDVGSIYLQTYHQLSANARDVLDLAAVLDQRFDIARLELLMKGRPFADIVDGIEAAEKVGLLRYDHDHYRFAHPTIRNQIYKAMFDTRRMRLHFSVAEHLLGREQAAGSFEHMQIAHHLVLARAIASDALVAEYSAKAAKQAKFAGAWDQAFVFARTAIDLSAFLTGTTTSEGEMQEIVGAALHQHGQPTQALGHLEDAAARFLAAGQRIPYAEARQLAARIKGNYNLATLSDLQELDELRELAVEIEPADRRLASRIYDTMSLRCMYAGRTDDALSFSQKAVATLADEQPCTEKVLALIQCSLASQSLLRLQSASVLLQEAVEHASAVRDTTTLARAHHQASTIDLMLGRFDALERAETFLAAEGDTIAHTGELTIVTATSMAKRVLERRLPIDDGVFESALEVVRISGYTWAMPRLVGSHAAGMCLTGRGAAAEALLESIVEDASLREIALHYGRQFARIATFVKLQRARWEGVSRPDVPPGYEYARFDGREYDAERILRYLLDLELAMATDNRVRADVATQALLFAHWRGALFTHTWPVSLTAVLVRALTYLQRYDDAAHFLSLAVDNLARLRLFAELAQLIDDIEGRLPTGTYAIKTARALLGEQRERGEVHRLGLLRG